MASLRRASKELGDGISYVLCLRASNWFDGFDVEEYCFLDLQSSVMRLKEKVVTVAKEEPKWYALKVLSGREKKIKSHLEAELARKELKSYVTQMLIPSEKVYELRAGKKRIKERNFFPGYIMVCAELSDGRVVHVVKDVPGVLGFLGAKSWGLSRIPVPLRKAEVDRILGRVNEAEDEGLGPKKRFIIGEMVKVIDGPFSSFSGSIQEIFEDRKKLNIMIKIFERNTPIELSYMQVEKLG